ncbi:Rib/alpha-like domain-containing protein, partial [Streptococcus mitis]
MYFNRKNAEQKNWRMIKKGKHFLFGCSLVFAVGASLATQVVYADTAEATVTSNSTTGDVNPTQNGDGKTYEAPAALAEIKPEAAGTPAVAAKLDGETAKEVKALDKTKLESYISEIETKLSNGSYANKTEESVAVLKADLEAAKATLANATTQAELKKAYSKLVTTVNSKLKNKPVEKKETPTVDTTNGKETVGKQAENTEPKSESNSIENTGSNDPRNNQRIPAGIQFRAEVAYAEDANAEANGHSDTYILNDVNRNTSAKAANEIVSRVTNYKVRYHKDENGKITSLDWLVYFNDHSENLSNTYHTDGGEVYRNYVQIPKEVNMPDTITRAQYAKPTNPKWDPVAKKFKRPDPNGEPVSASSTFDNPTPDSASGLPRAGLDTFNLKDWPSKLRGRSVENLATQLPRYFKDAASDNSPTTRDMLRGAAINEDRLIVDRSTTGGDEFNSYVWSFTTTVPNDTTNEQLKDMKVVFGMMRSATAGANAAFANIAANPVKMWQSDVSPEPTAKDQTVKVGQKPDAKKSIGNFDTLPQGTTVAYKEAVDTQNPGEKPAIAVVTYPDTSTKEVPVKVIVEKEAVAPAKPVITTSLTGKANTKTPVEVKAEAGSTVSLFAHDGTKLGSAVANDQGVASITPTVNIPTGIVAATATKNGKTSEVSDAVEATPAAVTPQPETPKEETPAAVTPQPETPTTSGPEIVNDLAGKASTPADVTVKAPAGSTVKLYNKDGVVIGEAVANDQGVATVHPTNSLPAGEITATSTPASGKESAKSTPITVTASPLTVKDGGVTGNNDTRLLVSRSEITVYPGDKIDVDVVAQATALGKFSVEKNPLAIKGVEPTGGYLDDPRGSTIRQRDAKYSGTVAMDQPAGSTSVIFHAKNRDKPTTIYRELIVNVLETAKKYEPVAGTKLDVANSNNLSEDDKNKVIASVKAANPSLPADSQYSVDEKGNLTITYPDGSKDKIAAAYLVNPAPTDADKNTPTGKPQTVDKGTIPKAEDSIGNVKDLPKGTKVAFKDPVDTATPGEKDAAVVVTYPDGSKEEVPVKVTVKDPSSAPTDADKNTPTGKPQTVDKGTTPKAEDSIGNVKDLPKGTKVAFKDPVDTATPGEKDATVVVTYPDGSKEEVPVKVTVKDPSLPEDPTTKDTDDDGLTDKEEADKGTDPKKADTDGDGLTDKEEADKGTDPKKADTDGDGLTDKEEADKGTDPKKADTDGDGLTDKEEADKGTDPKKADTDGDGFTDKEEVAKGTDPKDPNSKPESKPEDPATPDTKAPAKPEIKTDLTDKAGTKTPVEVTAEPGSKVELFDKDGNKLGEGVADEN